MSAAAATPSPDHDPGGLGGRGQVHDAVEPALVLAGEFSEDPA